MTPTSLVTLQKPLLLNNLGGIMELLYISLPFVESLYPLTPKETPTSSVILHGKTILEHIALAALQGDMDRVIHVTSDRKSLKLQHIGINPDRLVIHECRATRDCETSLEDTIEDTHVVVQLGSIITNNPKLYESVMSRWNESGGEILIVLTPDIQVLEESGINRIRIGVDLSKNELDKNQIGVTQGYNFTGIMIMPKDLAIGLLKQLVHQKWVQARNEITEYLVEFLKRQEYSITYHILTLPLYPVNTAWNLLLTSKEMLRLLKKQEIENTAKVSPSATIEGPVIVGEGAVIDHGAVIKGPVYIGRNALVGANSFVRSYTTIEEGSVIGALSEVKRSYIGPGATIGSHSHITDSLIGKDATIRPMSVTLNYDQGIAKKVREYEKKGAIVGKGAIVDGGSILRPSTIIEPGSVYSPSKR